MAKRIKYQHLKNYEFYSTLELSKKLGVSRSTVQYWAHHGLEPINREERRWKFNGRDVKIYRKKINNKFKSKTSPGEVYCFHCRASRRLINESIELLTTGRKLGKKLIDQITIWGNCAKCGSQCNQFSSENRVGEFLSHYPEIDLNRLNKQ